MELTMIHSQAAGQEAHPQSPIRNPQSAIHNGFTRADNWLWEHVMPRARPNTFKIVAAVMRETAGWHRVEALMTLDHFGQMTGIGSRSTLVAAIEDALKQGFIGRRPCDRSYCYRLQVIALDDGDRHRCADPPPADEGTPAEEGSGKCTAMAPAAGASAAASASPEVQKVDRRRSRNRTATSTESGPSSILIKKEKRKGKERVPPLRGGQLPGSRHPFAPLYPSLLPEKADPARKKRAGPPASGRASQRARTGRTGPARGAAREAAAPTRRQDKRGRSAGQRAALDKPYAVYRELAALEPGIPKGQTLAAVKRLLAGDPEANLPAYRGEEIVACARFLLSEPWRIERMVPLRPQEISQRIGKWCRVGRPQTWAAWEEERASSRPAGAQRRGAEPKGFAAIRAYLGEGE